MANIIGTVTLNEVDLIQVDGDPSLGAGTAAPLGSLALWSDGSVRGNTSIKFGVLNTDWVLNDYPINQNLISVLFDDFFNNATSIGELGWNVTNSGANTLPQSSTTGITATDKAQGVVDLRTGTTGSGRSAIDLGITLITALGIIIQKWRVWFPNLSDGTNTYQAIFGFGDTAAGASITQTNAIMFLYDQVTSANWICQTIAAGVTTSTTTTTAVVAGAFIKLKIILNPAGTNVDFYINDVLVATHTTNIPGAGQFIGPIAKIRKSVGTATRSALIDYFWQVLDWSVAR